MAGASARGYLPSPKRVNIIRFKALWSCPLFFWYMTVQPVLLNWHVRPVDDGGTGEHGRRRRRQCIKDSFSRWGCGGEQARQWPPSPGPDSPLPPPPPVPVQHTRSQPGQGARRAAHPPTATPPNGPRAPGGAEPGPRHAGGRARARAQPARRGAGRPRAVRPPPTSSEQPVVRAAGRGGAPPSYGHPRGPAWRLAPDRQSKTAWKTRSKRKEKVRCAGANPRCHTRVSRYRPAG